MSRFDELCRFLPPDMQSYWFSDGRGLEFPPMAPNVMRAYAARDFDAPTDIGAGAHTFVKAMDRGPEASAATIDDYPYHTGADPIGDRPVWHVTAVAGRDPEWLTFVDGRYTVSASTPELLAVALERGGCRERLLSFAPSAIAFADDAREFLLLRPRPQPESAPHFKGLRCGAPSPSTVLLAQLWGDGGEGRLQMLGTSQQSLADYARAWGAFLSIAARPTEAHDGLFTIDSELPDPSDLYLLLLFGVQVFI